MTKFVRFSEKQKTVLTWWKTERYKNCDAVICDGAVRSGKTLCMSVSFTAWAMSRFNGGSFAICGKTVTSLRRNVITPLLSALRGLGFSCTEKVSASYADISAGGKSNRFYFFGGKDEGSAALIQGITLCGVLLDEVALMPRSFVEQALARCSVSGSRLWFSCNPSHPYHWFYREWILKAQEKRALYLHFTMDDNPSLSPSVRERYRRLYSGVFYDRFILGKWVAAEGIIYPMFDESKEHDSQWAAIVSLGLTLNGQYPYIGGTNEVRLTQRSAEVFTPHNICEAGTAEDYSKMASHYHMKDVNGDYNYNYTDGYAEGRGIIRHKYINFDRQFLSLADFGLQYKLNFSRRGCRSKFMKYIGWCGEEIRSMIKFPDGTVAEVSAVEISGNVKKGIFTTTSCYYDKYCNT